MKLLVTGHCGFIGQNFVRMYKDQHEIFGVDNLSYASDPRALDLCQTWVGDIAEKDGCVEEILSTHKPDVIVNFAANSHVDNSITSPEPFMHSNYMGVFRLLEAVRKHDIKKYIQISSDEVYGDLQPKDPPFSNIHELKPSSPYSASKAAADLLVLSYIRTYGINAVITRACNNYGSYQYKEKLLPVVILNAMKDNTIPLYGDGLNMREWIHVKDNCEGVMAAIINGKSGDIYHLGSGIETTNIELIKIILKIMNKPESLINFVEDRKGHDKRYFLDSSSTYSKLQWQPKINLKSGLKETTEWFKNNPTYWSDKNEQ